MSNDASVKQCLIGWMASNPVAANLLMLVFLLGGLAVIPQLRQEVFPEFDLDVVIISVAYPGATPEDVEEGILLVTEEAIRSVDGIKTVTSTANEGVGTVNAELLLNADGNEVLQDIKSAIDRIVTYPLGAERPVVRLLRSRNRVLTILMHGDLPPADLKYLGESARDELLLHEAISTIEITGLPALEIAIEIPQAVMRAHGLTPGSVAQALAASSLDMAGGGIRSESGEILLRLDDRRDSGKDFKQAPVVASRGGGILRATDLGTIKDGFAETDQELYFNGRRAIGLELYRVGTEKPLDVSSAAYAFVEQLALTLPPGVGVQIVSDRSVLYRERLGLLLRNALLGLSLVMIILGLFLEVRLAFWVMMGIPVSFLGCLLFLPSSDVSINMISLFAFIISLGIVVDDAVVVGENVYHMREQGKSYLEAAVLGARQMAVPVILSILTNIAAVAPLLFVPGVQGKIWRNIPVIMVLVFTISLVEALFILPAHLANQKSKAPRGIWKILEWPQQHFGRAMDRFIRYIYTPVVRATLRARFLAVAVAVAALILTIGYLRGGHMRFTFFPQVESDQVRVSAVLPYGAPLSSARSVAILLKEKASALIGKYDDEDPLIGIETSVGFQSSGGPMASTQSGSHLVAVTVYLKPLSERSFSAGEFTRRWRELTGVIPGLESLSFRFTIGPSARRPVDVQLSHRDPSVTEAVAEEVADVLKTYNGVFEIDDGVARGKPQIEYQLTPQGSASGLNSREVGRQVRAAFFGAEVVRQQRGRDEVRTMVRLPLNERESVTALESLFLRIPGGGEIAFGDAVALTYGRAYDVIRRDQGRRVISVTADVDLRQTSSGEVLNALRSQVMPQMMQKYPGLYYSFEGERRDQTEAFRSLGVGFAAALFIIFALLAVPFRSYLQGLVVLSAVPFGFVGAVLGHLIMGYNLSFVSIMGIVALAGVVVNDNLILVDTMNRLRREGMSLDQAASEGPIRRFRPVLLTSMTTFFGLAPMIFETSIQARFMIPMALSLGFGILYTTLIALLVTPSLYLIVEKMKTGRN